LDEDLRWAGKIARVITHMLTTSLRNIPRSIWALGFVSLFMDMSSEMIHALLPLYMVTVLGTSVLTVGIIEGIAEATASITKIFSGVLSDWLGKRKLLAVIGYGLAAFTKPVFPLAESVGVVIAARFVDRIGKGIRGAPRDALVADLAPPDLRGASFGLRQSMDTVGAFIGPLLAMGLMLLWANNFRMVFWVAVIPAFLSFALMAFAVDEPAKRSNPKTSTLTFRDSARLPLAFWIVVAGAAVLTLARFSEAFLILRAQNVGLALAMAPLILVVMNVVYALAATPAGIVADKVGRTGILLSGIGCLIAADLVLATATTIWTALFGVVLWGLHMGLTQGVLATIVADVAPADLRGTAFGVFNFAIGIAMLIASVVAGGLWDWYGPQATFLAGAGFASLALIGLMLALKKPLTPQV
jgi:MFS family permease